MTDHDRIDRILSLLSLYWHAKPGFRLGQIVGNFTPTAHLGGDTYQFGDSYLVEDAVIEERLRAAIAALDFKPIARHPAGCVAHSNDGTKVVLRRDQQTQGRAWLDVEKQATVHLDEEALAPDPPRDPMGLEMCRGITPPQEDDQWKGKGARRWVKVQKRNDWQHDTYFYLDGDNERPLSGSGAPGVLRSVAVRWPDGLEDRLNVSVGTEHRRAYEQGPGSYAVESPVLEVGVILHGVEMSINLSEFEIDPASCEWDKSNE